MKKILFAASLLLFVGAIGTTAYAATASSDVQTEITKNNDDDKKKKKKKKKKADAKKKKSCEQSSCCSAKKKA